jgi:hypothetical protein
VIHSDTTCHSLVYYNPAMTASAVPPSIDGSAVPRNPILGRIVQKWAVCTILRIRRAADFGRRVHSAERTMSKQANPGIVFIHGIWADGSGGG